MSKNKYRRQDENPPPKPGATPDATPAELEAAARAADVRRAVALRTDDDPGHLSHQVWRAVCSSGSREPVMSRVNQRIANRFDETGHLLRPHFGDAQHSLLGDHVAGLAF